MRPIFPGKNESMRLAHSRLFPLPGKGPQRCPPDWISFVVPGGIHKTSANAICLKKQPWPLSYDATEFGEGSFLGKILAERGSVKSF